MRIGIFGGSFNPVHSGHVGIAKRAIEELALDRLLVVPAAESPFKIGSRQVLDDAVRVMLVRAAFNGVAKVEVDTREIERGGVSYSIDTVRSVSQEFPGAELFFVIGEDSVEGLPRWKDYAELSRLCTFKAFPRTAESSTEIRRRMESGEDFSALVPEAVALFIKHGVRESADAKIVAAVRSGLVRKEGYCPCRLPKLPEFFCPCDEFKGQLADPSYHGLCHCRLYDKPRSPPDEFCRPHAPGTRPKNRPMKFAIFSDVHANASALRKVLEDAKRLGAERFVCLGDIVGYGPEPAESIRLVQQAKAAVVAGNNDDAVSGRLDIANFTDFAADSAKRHKSGLRREDREWLAHLPYTTYLEGGAICAHGDIAAPEEFHYIDGIEEAAWNFAACTQQLIFVGHTHVPAVFITGRSGKTYASPPQDFEMEDGKRYIVNVGTVGYPREEDGKCMSSYVLYDPERGTVAFRFLPFSVASVMQRGAPPPEKEPPPAVSQPPPAASRKHAATASRQRRIVALAAVAFVVLAVLALAVAVRDGARSTVASPQPAPAAQAGQNAEPVVRTLVLGAKTSHVYAGLELAKNSPPAQLQVEFLNTVGTVISASKPKTVAKSANAKIKIAKGAYSARFTVAPVGNGPPPVISVFAPHQK